MSMKHFKMMGALVLVGMMAGPAFAVDHGGDCFGTCEEDKHGKPAPPGIPPGEEGKPSDDYVGIPRDGLAIGNPTDPGYLNEESHRDSNTTNIRAQAKQIAGNNLHNGDQDVRLDKHHDRLNGHDQDIAYIAESQADVTAFADRINIGKSGTTISSGPAPSIQQIDSGASGAHASLTLNENGVTLGGPGGRAIGLHGVADGVADHDAVNMRQGRQAFKFLNDRVDQGFNQMNSRMDDFEDDLDIVKQGVAMGAAMATMPMAYDGGNAWGIGTASFESQEAIAFGVSHHSEDLGVTFSLKAAFSDDTDILAFGIGGRF